MALAKLSPMDALNGTSVTIGRPKPKHKGSMFSCRHLLFAIFSSTAIRTPKLLDICLHSGQAAEKLLLPLASTSHSRGGHAERVAMLEVGSVR